MAELAIYLYAWRIGIRRVLEYAWTPIGAPNAAEPKPSHDHSFDTGAARALLALQATGLRYHAHGMTGAEFGRARKELHVPERFRFEAAVW